MAFLPAMALPKADQYNWADLLRLCLDSLVGQPMPAKCRQNSGGTHVECLL